MSVLSRSRSPIYKDLCKATRKALLVATAGDNKTKGQALLTPHRDARAWRDALIALYGYQEPDITLMLDDDETRCDPALSHLLPTKDNLLTQMRGLVARAKPGDRLMFYYNGHGTQRESNSKDEEDGFDEAIVPYAPDGEGDPILDDVLRKLLVDPLPAGATLMAIFDCCCAGTLLDLEHYRCNNVYFPWVNRGKRDLRVERRAVLRHGTVIHDSLQKKLELKSLGELPTTKNCDELPSGNTDVRFPQQGRVLQFRERTQSQSNVTATSAAVPVRSDTDPGKKGGRRAILVHVRACTLEVPRRRDSRLERRRPHRALSIPLRGTGICMQVQCAEPESYLQCDGFGCRPEVERMKPHVISLSACQDGEQTWDAPSGMTFTQALIGLLNKEPNMRIRRLIQDAGHMMYGMTTQRLHSRSQRGLEKWRRNHSLSEELPAWYEIFNSPMPQIGSTYFLPDDERFRA